MKRTIFESWKQNWRVCSFQMCNASQGLLKGEHSTHGTASSKVDVTDLYNDPKIEEFHHQF